MGLEPKKRTKSAIWGWNQSLNPPYGFSPLVLDFGTKEEDLVFKIKEEPRLLGGRSKTQHFVDSIKFLISLSHVQS